MILVGCTVIFRYRIDKIKTFLSAIRFMHDSSEGHYVEFDIQL